MRIFTTCWKYYWSFKAVIPYTLTLAGAHIVPKDGAESQPGKYYVDGKSKTLADS